MRGFIAVALLIFGLLGFSWLVTCGIVAAICACFELEFSWAIGTGVWLLMGLLSQVFKSSGSH